ncbi:MAG: DUF805 domain-containing protein [Caulobacter sp.]|nr:DUF805 domain-containing protein [Caulobacter sp.]
MPVMFRPLVRYADFLGRSRRSEFWLFYLLNFLVTAGCVVGGLIVERTTPLPGDAIGFWLLNLLYLATIVPWLAVLVRRLHDIDKSGWWGLTALIPFGIVVLITFLVREGVSGPNRFGPDPKAVLIDSGHDAEPGRLVPDSLP